jgi:hypothetical protein
MLQMLLLVVLVLCSANSRCAVAATDYAARATSAAGITAALISMYACGHVLAAHCSIAPGI